MHWWEMLLAAAAVIVAVGVAFPALVLLGCFHAIRKLLPERLVKLR